MIFSNKNAYYINKILTVIGTVANIRGLFL